MKKKVPLTCMSIFIIFIWLFPLRVEAKSFTIDAVDINAYIYPNGDLYVEELYTYTFKGAFNGTTRTIGDDKFKGVDFFEGYQVSDDAKMSTINPENTTPLPVELDDYTFKIHQPSEDETKKVFYRYRLKEVARKYKDIGEFYWRFFDDMGEDDLRNIRVFVQLANKAKLPDETYGFMHDLTDGKFEMTESGLYYENELLPGGEPFELRFLFPSEFLTDMELTENKEKLLPILEEEQSYEDQLDQRNKWLPKLEKVSHFILIALIPILIFSLFYPQRLFKFFRTAASSQDINKLDSLTLVAFHRNLNFKVTDIHAALFRLYQQGYISIKYIQANQKARENGYQAKNTFQYILKKHHKDCSSAEQFLIDWLFKQNDNGVLSFSLDELPLQYDMNQQSVPKEIRQKRNQFLKKFKEWKRLAKKDGVIQQFIKPVLLRRIFLFFILPLWLMILNINLWVITIDVELVTKLIVGYMSIIVPIMLINMKRERIITTIILFFTAVILPDIGFDSQMANFHDLSMMLIFVSAFIPATYPTFDGIPYYKGFKKWRKQVKKKTLLLPEEESQIEKIFQHAISIGLAFPFQANDRQKIQELSTKLYPLLIAPIETGNIYNYVHNVSNYSSNSSSGGSTSSGSGGSGGGGGAGAF